MKEPIVIERLKHWLDALKQIAEVDLDFEVSSEQLEQQLSQRGQYIEHLQQLDVFLAETSKWRRNGWPGLDESVRIRSEELIAQALSICAKIVEQDQQIFEKAKEKRQGILARIRSASQGREYLSTVPPADISPPLIVDDSV